MSNDKTSTHLPEQTKKVADVTKKTDGPPAPQNTQHKVEESREQKENGKR